MSVLTCGAGTCMWIKRNISRLMATEVQFVGSIEGKSKEGYENKTEHLKINILECNQQISE
jgi:hypothetical protein